MTFRALMVQRTPHRRIDYACIHHPAPAHRNPYLLWSDGAHLDRLNNQSRRWAGRSIYWLPYRQKYHERAIIGI